MINIDAIKKRLFAATRGPLYAKPNDIIGGWCVRTTDTLASAGSGTVADMLIEPDAIFIANVYSNILMLLAEIKQITPDKDVT